MTARTWAEDNEWERQWWASACNTFGEEYKALAYAKRMGLRMFHDGKSPFNFDLGGASVLDIGGGPCSLLLKCVNVMRPTVVDPCAYPDWVLARYAAAGITYLPVKGEECANVLAPDFDCVFLYNVLEHVDDPGKILAAARYLGKAVRIFEWIDTGTSPGHPHNLTEDWLNEQLSGYGKVEEISENTAIGKCYFGVFKGERYEV